MLFPSSYHTAIVQTGAAMFSIAAPIAGHSIAPIIDAPARPAIDYKMWSAVNDNTSQISVRGKGSSKPSETSSLSRFDDAHNEAIFTALMASSTEVSGPIYVD